LTDKIKLTEFSHGAGCGCKIAPAVLEEILHSAAPQLQNPNLLVGNSTKDDAAVFDLGNGTAIISTTDFFMPIVDDPFTFGGIASVNAISDIYAMGGTPIMAIAILGWPVDKLSTEVANKVIEGSRSVCSEAGISLAGGHSIDSPEPIFGLAVTGTAQTEHIKKNSKATADSTLYLTKPLGVGILSTAQKRAIITKDDLQVAISSMLTLNSIGAKLGSLSYVNAITDVTGFGLLGHLLEICEGSDVAAEITFDNIPIFKEALPYLEKGCVPGGTERNWQSYGHKVGTLPEFQRQILCDPQTSGGLLISVSNSYTNEFEAFLKDQNLDDFYPIGCIQNSNHNIITIK